MAQEQDPSLYSAYSAFGHVQVPEHFGVERRKPWSIALWAVGLVILLAAIGSFVSAHRGDAASFGPARPATGTFR